MSAGLRMSTRLDTSTGLDMSTGANHAVPRRAERIGVAGDWHGNRAWATACIRTLAAVGITELYHLGDLGIWPGREGRAYLNALEAELEVYGITMFVTPGNHEDYDQINALEAVDRGHEMGEIQWFTDQIAVLPRGHRWERNGWSFVSLGGAPSVDRAWRQDGISWWAAEAITAADVAWVTGGGPADIMLAHDAPDTGLGTPGVAQVLRSNPFGFPADALAYAAEGRHLMTKAFLAVRPLLFMHGHYHLSDETWIEHFEHPTHVVSLDCDGSVGGNLALVTLPNREELSLKEPGQGLPVDPLVEFLRMPAPK